MKLAEESSSLSRVEEEVYAIGTKPIILVEPTVQLTTRAARPAQRGIIIRKPMPQEQHVQEEVPKGNGKKKLKKALVASFRDSTPSSPRKAYREVEEKRLREEIWLQR